jgi:hypothetical protein
MNPYNSDGMPPIAPIAPVPGLDRGQLTRSSSPAVVTGPGVHALRQVIEVPHDGGVVRIRWYGSARVTVVDGRDLGGIELVTYTTQAKQPPVRFSEESVCEVTNLDQQMPSRVELRIPKQLIGKLDFEVGAQKSSVVELQGGPKAKLRLAAVELSGKDVVVSGSNVVLTEDAVGLSNRATLLLRHVSGYTGNAEKPIKVDSGANLDMRFAGESSSAFVVHWNPGAGDINVSGTKYSVCRSGGPRKVTSASIAPFSGLGL